MWSNDHRERAVSSARPHPALQCVQSSNLTIVEIATLLGKRESAVQKQLSRVIQRLKERFHESEI